MSESETSFNPQDFAEFSTILDKTIVLGIEIGMDLETRSRNFYQNMALNVAPDKRILLKFLANEELNHLRTLMAFQIALQKNGNWILLSQEQLKTIKIPKLYEGKSSTPFTEDGTGISDMISAAMKLEKETERFYKKIGKRTKDLNVKLFFDFLAQFEKGHYIALKSLLTTY